MCVSVCIVQCQLSSAKALLEQHAICTCSHRTGLHHKTTCVGYFCAHVCAVQWQLSSAKALLEQRALASITLDTTQGSRGQELTTLTVVCKEEDGDQIAAALLQVRQ